MLASTVRERSRAPEPWLHAACPGIPLWCGLGPNPPPLLSSFVPSLRSESAATGQLVTKCTAGMQGVLLPHHDKVHRSAVGKTGDSCPGTQPRGAGSWPGHKLRMALCPIPFSPHHIMTPEGKGHGPVSNGIRTQSRSLSCSFEASGFLFLIDQTSPQACGDPRDEVRESSLRQQSPQASWGPGWDANL